MSCYRSCLYLYLNHAVVRNYLFMNLYHVLLGNYLYHFVLRIYLFLYHGSAQELSVFVSFNALELSVSILCFGQELSVSVTSFSTWELSVFVSCGGQELSVSVLFSTWELSVSESCGGQELSVSVSCDGQELSVSVSCGGQDHYLNLYHAFQKKKIFIFGPIQIISFSDRNLPPFTLLTFHSCTSSYSWESRLYGGREPQSNKVYILVPCAGLSKKNETSRTTFRIKFGLFQFIVFPSA